MRLTIIFILLLISKPIFAQNTETYLGVLPEISLNYNLKDFKVNSKVESFQLLHGNGQTGNPGWNYTYEQTDVQFFISRRLNPFSALALGYQLGMAPGEKSSHRVIQQYSYVTRPGVLKWGHRVRAEQTFYQHKATKFRFRYRLSLELPLQGRSIDYNEFYVVASDELLYAIQDKGQEYENRFGLYLGYFFENKNKFQLGIDYRTDFSGEPLIHNYWVRLGYLINL